MSVRWARFGGIIGGIFLFIGVTGGSLVSGNIIPYFFMSHIVLGILLIVNWLIVVSTKPVKGSRTSATHQLKLGGSSLIYSVLFLSLVVGVNWFVLRHNTRWDLTSNAVYSLSSQSKELIQNLKEPVEIVAIDTKKEDPTEIQDLLTLYSEANPTKITTKIIDPKTKPHLLEQYEIKSGNVAYLSYGQGETKAVSRLNEFSEGGITNGILKLSRGAAKKIYFLAGHGEPELTDANENGLKALAEALKDEHFQTDTLVLSTEKKTPDDAAAIVVVSPQKDLFPSEVKMLQDYAENGGSLLLLHDPRQTTSIKDIATKFGIKVNDDVVLDVVQQLFQAPSIGIQLVAFNYGISSITQALPEKALTVFNLASSITVNKSEGVESVDLVKSSPNAWGESSVDELFASTDPKVSIDPEVDTKGPVTLGISYEKQVKTIKVDNATTNDNRVAEMKKTKIIVFGDSDWVRNSWITQGNTYNRDLILNSVTWLVGIEDTMAIRPRKMEEATGPLMNNVVTAILMGGFLVPELFLIFGLLVWWNRKQYANN
jgi:ABC-type uncharacterized transport system involved in gliding motility auxiliary subunit